MQLLERRSHCYVHRAAMHLCVSLLQLGAKGKCTRGYIWPTLRRFSQSCVLLTGDFVLTRHTLLVNVAEYICIYISRPLYNILHFPADQSPNTSLEPLHFAISNRALRSTRRGARINSHSRLRFDAILCWINKCVTYTYCNRDVYGVPFTPDAFYLTLKFSSNLHLVIK